MPALNNIDILPQELTDEEADEQTLLLQLPRVPDAAFYGPLGRFALAAAKVSEASPQAILVTALAHVSAYALAPFCVGIGHEQVPITVNTLLFGPSAYGRKGSTESLVADGLIPAIAARVKRARKLPQAVRDAFLTRIHKVNSLISGEGLVQRLSSETPAANDRRLLLSISEFGGVLQTMLREGNTLSSKLRDAIDGRTIDAPRRKDPDSAAAPHVAGVGHITAFEFMRLMGGPRMLELDNGLLNRMLGIFTVRSQLIAIPPPVPGITRHADAVIAALARVYTAYRIAPHGAGWYDPKDVHVIPVPFSAAGEREWKRQYESLTTMLAESESAAKILQRTDWHTRKIAAAYALTNGEHTVSRDAIKAACALVGYTRDSVNKVMATLEERVKQRQVIRVAERLFNKLAPTPQPFRDIVRALNLPAAQVHEALAYLMDKCSPPRARIIEKNVARGNHGAAQKRVLVARNG